MPELQTQFGSGSSVDAFGYGVYDPIENQWIIRDKQGKLIKTSQKEIFSEKMIFQIAKMSKN